MSDAGIGRGRGPGLGPGANFAGCGAKLGPGLLDRALCGLAQPDYPGLVADFRGSEDAGLFRVAPGLLLVQTADFFPPIVDDPFLFGRIAAANALSDVYAMGGRPLTALALVCFPSRELGFPALREMMEGGLEALVEAGCALVGGHTIEDPVPKLGYAVTGLVEEGAAWRNNTLEPGLSLILTKAIGTGLVNAARRAGVARPEAVAAAEASMAALNARAAEILAPFHPVACTDVTGFGLAGHAAEMAAGGKCGLRLWLSALPFLPGAREFAAMGLVPEATRRNREGRGGAVVAGPGIGPLELDLLFDPQTSGGLLVALAPAAAEVALGALRGAGIPAAIVGESGGSPGRVEVFP